MVAQASHEKSTLERVYELCDLVESTGGIKERLGISEDGFFVRALKLHLVYFLSYLAASDGVISWSESQYISGLFDMFLTPDRLNEIIIENDLYSTRFENEVPILLQIFVAIDNAIYGMPQASFIDEELGSVLFKLYAILAKGLIEANGRTVDDLDENEEEDLQAYLGMLQKYIDENTEKHHVDLITGYSKHMEDDNEKKGGVRAPKKDEKRKGAVKAPKKKN